MFDEATFLHDLDQEIIKGSFYQHEEAFAVFSPVFRDVVNRHAPLKQKAVCGNSAPIITKQLNKAIMDRSRIKKRYSKCPSREKFLELEKAKRLSKNLTKKADMAANKQFWDAVKPFFSNRNLHSSINDKDKIVDNEVKLVELFNAYFINAVGNRTRKTPTSLGDSSNQQKNTDNVKKIVSEYKDHPSVVKINETFKNFGNFDLPKARPKDINKIIKSLNHSKSNILNSGKDKVKEIKNHRPVSVLSSFSKIY